MRKVIKYICDICGKEFSNETLAFEHEEKCNKCAYCKHAYLVCGVDFNCEKLKDKSCNQSTFPAFESK